MNVVRAINAPEMDDNHWNTLKNLLDAMTDLPGVAERVEAYMMGRGIEDPHAEIQALIDLSDA